MSTVADQLLNRLREWGVTRVFGYPGNGINGKTKAQEVLPGGGDGS